MTPEHTTHPAITLLGKTREDLYQLADRAPALSARLTAATLAITEILTQFGEPTMTTENLHEQLLTASNAIAAAGHEPAAYRAAGLELARASGALGRVRELFGRARLAPARRHLRLVHSA